MDLRNLPREERVCVNCKHYRKSRNPIAWLAYCLGDQHIHRCTLDSRQESFNIITGKVAIKIKDRSCQIQRSYTGGCHNPSDSSVPPRWEPSERWMRKKEHLFKILKT
jgi:hypothetical protein